MECDQSDGGGSDHGVANIPTLRFYQHARESKRDGSQQIMLHTIRVVDRLKRWPRNRRKSAKQVGEGVARTLGGGR